MTFNLDDYTSFLNIILYKIRFFFKTVNILKLIPGLASKTFNIVKDLANYFVFLILA